MSSADEIPREGGKVTFQDNSCFVCGDRNPIGLHLKFKLDRENHRASSSVKFTPEHQGWDGVVHGGLLASVLDDVMAYAIMTTDNLAITTKMTTKYRQAVSVGETLHLEGEVVKLTRRLGSTRAVAYVLDNDDPSRRIIKVEAEGTYYLDHPLGGDTSE
jgi:uncharacterized protein (TIGR00369 family)